jgi:hypothetical protein
VLDRAATLARVGDEPPQDEQLARVHRCLLASYEERLEGHALPEREQTLLD